MCCPNLAVSVPMGFAKHMDSFTGEQGIRWRSHYCAIIEVEECAGNTLREFMSKMRSEFEAT